MNRWKLTPHAKAAIIKEYKRLRKKHTKNLAAKLIGIPWETLYKWQRRFTDKGVKGLEPRKPTGRPRHVKFTVAELAKINPEDRELIQKNPGGRFAYWFRSHFDRSH